MIQVDIIRQGDLSHVNGQDRRAGLLVGAVESDLAVKTARAEQGTVEYVRPVGGSQYQNIFVSLETVHFREDLVQCLLSFIMATTQARTT